MRMHCLALSLVLWVGPAAADCKLGRLLELPVTMVDMHPMVTARVNGMEAQFIADSGAFYSMMSPAGAEELKLKTHAAPWGLQVQGLGGAAGGLSLTVVKDFTLQGLTVHDVDFLVGGGDVDGVGVIGQNVLRIGDVEYDLAHGVIRLIREQGCSRANNLAYWISGTTQTYSVIDIGDTTPLTPNTTTVAYINDVKVRVMFDTGAFGSFLTKRAALRAGIKFDAPGVVREGETRGVGKTTVPTWVATIGSFKLGDEEIRNTKLRIGDTEIGDDIDMLLGADFFLSHRVYVASKQRRLFFTYNGGPVFNLASSTKVLSSSAEGQPTTEPPPQQTAPPESAAGAAPDPAELARRGSASAARHAYLAALSDLDRACALAPSNADYRYQRGLVHLEMQQRDLALADYDQALTIDPGHLPARLARASLRLADGDSEPAAADLDAADRVADKSADVRLRMAFSYAEANRMTQSLDELELWIASHREDARLGEALYQRCWVRAVANQQLKGALDDCNAALKRVEKTSEHVPQILDGRGLVRLRLGDYATALKDFSAVLGMRPNDAWALYGRGIVRLRMGDTGQGEADVAAAKSEAPTLVEKFQGHGIAP